YATLSAGSSTTPSVAPAVRAAAADAKRQILEMAEQRYGENASKHSLPELLSVLGNAQILGAGSRGPNPTGMTVLTFGVQVAEVASELIAKPDTQLTSLGSKGIGEPPIVPVAAAIANAIRDATGADVRSLPITREEMLRALAEAKERSRGAAAAV